MTEREIFGSIVAGIMLGLSVALPFGPISLVCVQRSMSSGFRYGAITGVGAASAQGIFATGALFAQGIISLELDRWSGPIHWLSAILLLLLGMRTLTRRNQTRGPTAPGNLPAAFASSLALALSNPMTVLPYLAVASGVATANTPSPVFSSWSVPGVITGAVGWYVLLSSGASLFRMGLAGGLLRQLNLISGTMLIAFGIWVGLR